MKKYDIFISYRREGGAETAKHLRDTLTEKGYTVFLDVESLRSGQFNTALYEVIENSKDFLLLLPANGLDRCVDEEDWVRLEIEHAKKCDKNIVPVFLKGFEFPDALPDSLEFLRTQNGLTANVDYYDAFIGHLEKFFKSKHTIPKNRRWIPAVIAVVLVAAIAFGTVKYFVSYPHNAAQRNLVSQVSVYLFENLKYEDLASVTYQNSLERMISYLQGKSLDTYDDVIYKLDNDIKSINSNIEELKEPSKELSAAVSKSPFEQGELDATAPALKTFMSYYVDRLTFFRQSLQTIHDTPLGKDEELNAFEQKQLVVLMDMLTTEQEMSQLFAEELFYNINLTFLPVNVESALTTLKSEYLPELTTIYSKRLDFIKDEKILEGKLDNIQKQEIKLTQQDEENVKKLKQLWNDYLKARESNS